MASKMDQQGPHAGDSEDLEQSVRKAVGMNGAMLTKTPQSDRVAVHLGGTRQPSGPLPATQECAGSESVESFISRHYNPGSDVVLRWEFIHDSATKRVLIGLWTVEAVGFIFLLTGIALKVDRSQRWFFSTHFQEAANVACGFACWLALMICGFLFAKRLIQQRHSHKRWSARRKRTAWRAGLDHIFTTINVSAYLASNLYVVSGDCRWFSRFVVTMGTLQWSCWNATFALFLMHAHDTNLWDCTPNMKGYRTDAIVMDAPRWYHWPKLVMFLLVEGVLVAIGVYAYRGHSSSSPEVSAEACRQLDFRCRMTPVLGTLVPFVVACFFGYFLGVLYYLRRALKYLRRQPYVSLQLANQNVRLQARVRAPAMAFFIFCVILYIFVGWGTCSSYLQAWMGFLPMYIVMTGVTVAITYLTMPKNPHENLGLLQVWLQEFSWSEDDLPARLAERKSGLSHSGARAMDREPMFCFETSLKMLFWSQLVYRYEEEATLSGVTLAAAMALYDLKHFELLWERERDTKALMAWNDDTMVLSFRGTASLKNVMADLRAWYAAHPPLRGKWWLASRPFVHQGFLRSWHAAGLKLTAVQRIHQILSDMAAAKPEGTVRVFVTGHSLGGALATLAAFDIQAACKDLPNMSLTVYTFGAPRTGNHAFAREYNASVPNTWNVINDQDTVPRTGKFWFLYKRPGQRVLINSDGDMIVRPSFIEAAVQRRATSSVAHHLLVNYQKAHIAIIKAQFLSKALRDGALGVVRIAEACGMERLLRHSGIEARDLRKLSRISVSPEMLQKSPKSSGSGSPPGYGHILGRGSARRSRTFSVDFDVAAAAAMVAEDDEEAQAGHRNGDAPGDAAGAEQLEAATSLPFLSALDRSEQGRPSAEVTVKLAAGGDVALDDMALDALPNIASNASAATEAEQSAAAAAPASAAADTAGCRGGGFCQTATGPASTQSAASSASHTSADLAVHWGGPPGSEAAAPDVEAPQQGSAGDAMVPPGQHQAPPSLSTARRVMPGAEATLQHSAGSMTDGWCNVTHTNGAAQHTPG